MNKEEQYNLALEIVKLQDELKEGKKNNKHARLKCNLKKIGAISKIGMVFSAVPLAGTLITSAAGWNPFKLNDKEIPVLITTTIDKDGNKTEEKDYKEDNECIHVNYYTAWEKTDNNNYSREIYTYSLSMDSDINSLIELMNPSEEINQERLEELIKQRINYHIKYQRYSGMQEEYIPTVKNEDLKRGNYIEITIQKQDKTDIKVIKESMGRHLGLEILKLIIEWMLVALELNILYYKTDFFENTKEDLKEKPYYINTKRLEQQLKAKQMLFETMPYQLLQQEQLLELPEKSKEAPQKVLKKEPEKLYQQGQ